jgi:hypothetical protein
MQAGRRDEIALALRRHCEAAQRRRDVSMVCSVAVNSSQHRQRLAVKPRGLVDVAECVQHVCEVTQRCRNVDVSGPRAAQLS